MLRAAGLAVALGFIFMACAVHAAEAESGYRHNHHQHRVREHRMAPDAVPQPRPTASPTVATNPRSDQDDTDGLSRDPNDCDTGCIGGNPD